MTGLETATTPELLDELHKRCRLVFCCYELKIEPQHVKLSAWVQPGNQRAELIGMAHYAIHSLTDILYRQQNGGQ